MALFDSWTSALAGAVPLQALMTEPTLFHAVHACLCSSLLRVSHPPLRLSKLVDACYSHGNSRNTRVLALLHKRIASLYLHRSYWHPLCQRNSHGTEYKVKRQKIYAGRALKVGPIFNLSHFCFPSAYFIFHFLHVWVRYLFMTPFFFTDISILRLWIFF